MMHRQRIHLFMLAIVIPASLWLSGCHSAATSVAAGKYVRKDDASQTLTIKAAPSRVLRLTGSFTGKFGAGTFSLKTSSGTDEGTFSYHIEEGKDRAEFALKSGDGKLWSLKETNWGELEDKDGHTWKMEEEF
jgi:hypothetical protein